MKKFVKIITTKILASSMKEGVKSLQYKNSKIKYKFKNIFVCMIF